jgi:PAS domain S-box-containing protein
MRPDTPSPPPPTAAACSSARERALCAELAAARSEASLLRAALASATSEAAQLRRATLGLASINRTLAAVGEGLCLTNSRAEIVYVNEGFLRLTGYPKSYCLGRNCAFLQGEGTDPATVAALRAAIAAGRALRVDVLNYRRDGRPFWNDLSITPVRADGAAEGGEVQYYVGIQSDVSRRYGLRDGDVVPAARRSDARCDAVVAAAAGAAARGAAAAAPGVAAAAQAKQAEPRQRAGGSASPEEGRRSGSAGAAAASKLTPDAIQSLLELDYVDDARLFTDVQTALA